MEFNVKTGAGPSKMPMALDKVPKPIGFNVKTSADEMPMESDVATAVIPQDPLAHAPPSKSIEPQLKKFTFSLTPQATKAQDGDSSRSPTPQLDLQRAKQQCRWDIGVSQMNWLDSNYANRQRHEQIKQDSFHRTSWWQGLLFKRMIDQLNYSKMRWVIAGIVLREINMFHCLQLALYRGNMQSMLEKVENTTKELKNKDILCEKAEVQAMEAEELAKQSSWASMEMAIPTQSYSWEQLTQSSQASIETATFTQPYLWEQSSAVLQDVSPHNFSPLLLSNTTGYEDDNMYMGDNEVSKLKEDMEAMWKGKAQQEEEGSDTTIKLMMRHWHKGTRPLMWICHHRYTLPVSSQNWKEVWVLIYEWNLHKKKYCRIRTVHRIPWTQSPIP